MAEQRLDYTQWLKRGGNKFIPTDNAKTVESMDAGVYNLRYQEGLGFYMFKKELKLDDLIEFDSAEHATVFKSIKDFWASKDKFKEYGFVYKRGILLYGPPGTGKSSLINMITKKLIDDHNGIVIVLSNGNELDLYHAYVAEVVRQIEPNRPIITVIEDIDGLCSNHNNETQLINILDGIEQLDNVVYIATTNYPERLSERITNRPNRFDRRVLVGFPTAKTRKMYIEAKLKPHDLDKIDIKEWVKKTDKFTISHIGELIKSVIILGNDFEETIKLLKTLKEIPNSHDLSKGNRAKKIGYGEELEDDDDDIDWGSVEYDEEYNGSNIKDSNNCSEGIYKH